LHTADDGTRISSWIREKGEEFGRWKILGGTGKFAGVIGQGTYKPTPLPEGPQISEYEGEVTLSQ
jgi:hypothetical protein